MSLTALIILAAVVTVGSRVAALALLPEPRGHLVTVVRRLPAPLFAALAVLSLSGSEGGAADPRILTAVTFALLATRRRSLVVILIAGLGGFLLATLIW